MLNLLSGGTSRCVCREIVVGHIRWISFSTFGSPERRCYPQVLPQVFSGVYSVVVFEKLQDDVQTFGLSNQCVLCFLDRVFSVEKVLGRVFSVQKVLCSTRKDFSELRNTCEVCHFESMHNFVSQRSCLMTYLSGKFYMPGSEF